MQIIRLLQIFLKTNSYLKLDLTIFKVNKLYLLNDKKKIVNI